MSLGKVETSLLTNPLIDNICVYGDSQSDYLIALVVPNQKNLEKMAEEVSWPFPSHFSQNGIKGSWEQICENQDLAKVVIKNLTAFVSGE